MSKIEIKIVVPENKKKDLQMFISDCKLHGFKVIQEGGGRLPHWSGWYASLEGENWCPLSDVTKTNTKFRLKCKMCGMAYWSEFAFPKIQLCDECFS